MYLCHGIGHLSVEQFPCQRKRHWIKGVLGQILARDAANFCRGRQKFAGEGIFPINSVEAQHTAMEQFFIRSLFINYYVRKSA